MNIDTIDHSTLKGLIETGANCLVTAVCQGSSWSLSVHCGITDKALQSKNSQQIRTWAHLDSLVKYLNGLGIRRFNTDATNYDPQQQTTKKRPDRAEALKQTYEAASYDKWFREQIAVSMSDTRPNTNNADAKRKFSAKRDALRQFQ